MYQEDMTPYHIEQMCKAEKEMKLIRYFYEYSNLINSWEAVFFNIEDKLTKIFLKMYKKFMKANKYSYMEGINGAAEKYLHFHQKEHGIHKMKLGEFPFYTIEDYLHSDFHKQDFYQYYYGDYYLIRFILDNYPPKSIKSSYFLKKINKKYFDENIVRYSLHLDENFITVTKPNDNIQISQNDDNMTKSDIENITTQNNA